MDAEIEKMDCDTSKPFDKNNNSHKSNPIDDEKERGMIDDLMINEFNLISNFKME